MHRLRQKKAAPLLSTLLATGLMSLLLSLPAAADTPEELDLKADQTLATLTGDLNLPEQLFEDAEAVLIFPTVVKSGYGADVEYGKGTLRIGGKSVDYYETTATAFGIQVGAHKKALVLLFFDPVTLEQFRNSSEWIAGEDGDIAVLKTGSELPDPMPPLLAIALDGSGPMHSFSLEGSTFRRLVQPGTTTP